MAEVFIPVYKFIRLSRSGLKFAMLIALLWAIPNLSFARHIVGGELSYTYAGNNYYIFTLKLYRDCSSNVAFDDPLYLTIFDSSGTALDNISISFPGSTNLPINTGNICLTAPPNLCVDEATYVSDPVYLPPTPGGYTIVYQRCCRNDAVENIVNAGMTGASYVVTIPDNTLANNNNSPVFNNYPPLVICVNEPLSIDQSATDPDGDSLVYGLYNPFAGASSNNPEPTIASPPPFDKVIFTGGYSYTNPMGGSPPLSINPKTGLLTVTPTAIALFVVGICVYEYRNGKLLGIHYRDFEFDVVACLQNVHAHIFTTNHDTIKNCLGTSINFPNNSSGGTYYHWDFGISGITNDTSDVKGPSYTYASTGTYKVVLTVNPRFSCASYDTVTVIVYPIPTTSVSNNGPLCVGDSLKLTSKAVTKGTYAWTGPNGFTSSLQNPSIPNPALVNAGAYKIIATANGCPSASPSTTVVIYPIPAALTISSNSPVCNGALLQLNANTVAGGTYKWTGPPAFSSNLQNPSIAKSVLADSGVYTATITVNGCTSPPVSTKVIVNPIPNPPAVSNNSPFCEGATLNLISTTVAGASYAWTGPNKFTSSAQNPVITNTTAVQDSGTYSATVTVKGCTSAAATTIATIYLYPKITAGSNNPACLGLSIRLSVGSIAAATYSWTGPNGFTSSLQNPVINNIPFADSGIYSVTVTANGCGSTSNTTVHIFPIPAAPTISNNAPLCAGQLFDLFASNVAGGTFTWAGPNGFTADVQNPVIPDVPFSDSGIYTATVTVNGCTSPPSNTSLGLIKFTPPATPVNNGSLCVGQTLNLTTTPFPGVAYAWMGPNNFTSTIQSPSISNVTLIDTGNYLLTMTVRGCTGKTAATKVLIYPIPAAPVLSSNSPICAVQTLQLNAANATGGTFNWLGPVSYTSSIQNPSITNTTVSNSGNYSATVTVNGCTSPSASIAVVVKPVPPTPTITSNSSVCAGQTLTLDASNELNATYAWIGPDNFISTLQHVAISNAGLINTGVYSVTDTVNGCSSLVDTFTAKVYPIPSSAFTVDSPLCAAYATLAHYTGSSLPTAIYNWNFGAALADSSAGQGPHKLSWASAGSYPVSLTVTEFGCTSPVTTQTLTVHPVPSPVFTSPAAICLSDSALIVYTGTGSSAATYNWNFTGANILSGTGQGPITINYDSAGTYSLILSVKELGCLSPSDTQQIVIYPVPTGNFTVSPHSICPNENAVVTYTGTGTAADVFQWNYDSGIGTRTGIGPHSIYFIKAGKNNITLVVSDNICPSKLYSQVLTVDSLPLVNFTVPDSGCAPFSANFINETLRGYGYLWRFTDNTTDTAINPTHIFKTGTYGVELISTTESGCMDSIFKPNLIHVYADPVAKFSYSPTSNPIEIKNASFTFNNRSKYADSFTWYFGDGDSATDSLFTTHIYTTPGNYTMLLVAKNDVGCTDTFKINIEVIPNIIYAVPNVFTPNHDGINDVFLVYGVSLASVHLTVYDRIGEKVFESTDMNEGWDGTFKGKPMNTGVFVYYAEIRTLTDKEVLLKGDVLLMR